MDLLDVMRTTPSVREFTDAPVSDETLYSLLDHARFAPNGGNRQGWHVVVLKDPARRSEILALLERGFRPYLRYREFGVTPFAPGMSGRFEEPPFDVVAALDDTSIRTIAPMIATAPVMMVLLADVTKLACVDNGLDRQPIIGGGSIYPFAHNILLAARSKGLGGVLMTVLAREEVKVRELLGFPQHVVVAGFIALGTPVKVITKLKRAPVEEFATIDRYDGEAFTVNR
ncbi:MAG: nitroreductase family protein [Acidimicrobiia bacterium]